VLHAPDARRVSETDPAGPRGDAGGIRRSRAVSRIGRGRLHHRRDDRRQRRTMDGLTFRSGRPPYFVRRTADSRAAVLRTAAFRKAVLRPAVRRVASLHDCPSSSCSSRCVPARLSFVQLFAALRPCTVVFRPALPEQLSPALLSAVPGTWRVTDIESVKQKKEGFAKNSRTYVPLEGVPDLWKRLHSGHAMLLRTVCPLNFQTLRFPAANGPYVRWVGCEPGTSPRRRIPG